MHLYCAFCISAKGLTNLPVGQWVDVFFSGYVATAYFQCFFATSGLRFFVAYT